MCSNPVISTSLKQCSEITTINCVVYGKNTTEEERTLLNEYLNTVSVTQMCTSGLVVKLKSLNKMVTKENISNSRAATVFSSFEENQKPQTRKKTTYDVFNYQEEYTNYGSFKPLCALIFQLNVMNLYEHVIGFIGPFPQLSMTHIQNFCTAASAIFEKTCEFAKNQDEACPITEEIKNKFLKLLPVLFDITCCMVEFEGGRDQLKQNKSIFTIIENMMRFTWTMWLYPKESVNTSIPTKEIMESALEKLLLKSAEDPLIQQETTKSLRDSPSANDPTEIESDKECVKSEANCSHESTDDEQDERKTEEEEEEEEEEVEKINDNVVYVVPDDLSNMEDLVSSLGKLEKQKSVYVKLSVENLQTFLDLSKKAEKNK